MDWDIELDPLLERNMHQLQDSNAMPHPSHLEAEAFKRLYPDQYLAKFLEQSVRPDGRLLGVARPISISNDVITTADSSALVKIGNTTVLAGIKCEVMVPTDARPAEGVLAVEVEMPPMCSASTRPGRLLDEALTLGEHLETLLIASLDLTDLCIDPGRAAWAVYLDVYILDADGSLQDACLLSAVASLSALRLPYVELDDSGNVQAAAADGGSGPALLRLKHVPVSLTCALHGDVLLVDPTYEEEDLVESVVTVVVNEEGELLKVTKPGGGASLTPDRLRICHEAAKARASDTFLRVLKDALKQAKCAG